MSNRYLIQNGTLLSILDGSEVKKDILVEDGIITKIAEHIEDTDVDCIDAAGQYVSVGWLEAHAHFAGVDNSLNIDPNEDLLKQGVTYALDLGTLGPDNFEAGRNRLLAETGMKFRCYLCISNDGIGGRAVDFEGPEDIDREKVIACAKKYRHELMGLKARIDDKFCFDPEYVMTQLRALGDELNIPIAVHAPRSRIGIDKLLTFMKKGDVLCHTLAGNSEAMDVLDADGKIKQCVLDAQERGVIFELSHGTNAYSYDTAEAAWKAGFFVDTVCSDVCAGSCSDKCLFVAF